MKDTEAIFREIEKLMVDLTGLTKSYSSKINFFTSNSITVKFDNEAHCFDQVVSWIYVAIYESCGKNFDFLFSKASLEFNLPPDILEIKKTIHAFRTVQQHNITGSIDDQNKLNHCHAWFTSKIGELKPSTPIDWKKCVDILLSTFKELLETLLKYLKQLKNSEFFNIVINDWEIVNLRDFPKYRYDKIVELALNNLGLKSYLTVDSVTPRFLQSWRKSLDDLPDNFNFDEDIYPFIEKSIVSNDLIPIDGRDLINAGIPKGNQISEKLEKAKQIFKQTPCSKEDLLKKVFAQ